LWRCCATAGAWNCSEASCGSYQAGPAAAKLVQQLTRACDVLGTSAIGEETIVMDAVETIGQNVDEEATDELVGPLS
jgi:hypothetical protein